ncbi:MAG: hypothetical protein JWN86_3450 [Planctomycetota bacterium]|nr:hypothetical protein [Planctomycetota bacterium]
MTKRFRLALSTPAAFCGALVVIFGGFAGAQDENRPPMSLYDPRLGELRRASVKWDMHRGPTRRVIDQVALVPDLPSFFAAISTWDESNWFPILIDDADLAPKFLRAFRPSRVIRYPGRPKAIAPEEIWEVATVAVANAWAREAIGPPEKAENPGLSRVEAPKSRTRSRKGLRGDTVPNWINQAPPGVVVSSSSSPSLAGAVALAAGRFQPLVQWEPPGRKVDRLTEQEARRLTLDLEAKLADVTPQYAIMGDACDFITLAGEYPDRYQSAGSGLRAGTSSFDDLVGRDRETLRRWAYTGRLTGDATESVYRAMCSLFLQPGSALLFDGYDAADPDFRDYQMKAAATRIPKGISVTVASGSKADLDGWRRVMGSLNSYGLILMNSSGGTPFAFSVAGGQSGVVPEIPPSVPTIMIMIHSNSAGDPANPRSIAGAWMTGGAFLYFGAVSEPYLTSFRTPALVASLLNEEIPIGAAVRMGMDENPVFGGPWRLMLLGDPLYRLDLRAAKAPRWPSYELTDNWTAYADAPLPNGPGVSEGARLAWAAKTTILVASRNQAPTDRPELEATIVSLRREGLAPNLRPILDDLLIDLLPRSRDRREQLLDALLAIPEAERSPKVRRAIETGRLTLLASAINRKDFTLAVKVWDLIVRSDATMELKQESTRRVGQLAEKSAHVAPWKTRLKEIMRDRPGIPEANMLQREFERIEKLGAKAVAPSVRRGG